jgi:hypothetical protein
VCLHRDFLRILLWCFNSNSTLSLIGWSLPWLWNMLRLTEILLEVAGVG